MCRWLVASDEVNRSVEREAASCCYLLKTDQSRATSAIKVPVKTDVDSVKDGTAERFNKKYVSYAWAVKLIVEVDVDTKDAEVTRSNRLPVKVGFEEWSKYSPFGSL